MSQFSLVPDRNRDPFNWLRKEVDQLFQNTWPSSGKGLDPVQRVFYALPMIDVEEHGNDFVVTADVPGLQEEDLTVEFNNKVLTIKGEKKIDREEKEKNYYMAERWSGQFQRSIQIPFAVKEEAIHAQIKDGVLRITLPKAENHDQKTKSITVQKG